MHAKPVILCVDDEAVNLDLLEAMLAPRGYEVIRSPDGTDALRVLAKTDIDVVLLDVMLPEIDGFEVCRRIKSDEQYRTIPVVMITSLTAREDRIRGIEAGAEDFLSKPIDSVEVLARVKMLLRIKDLNDRLASAYSSITSMVGFGESMLLGFDPLNFDFLHKIDGIVRNILRTGPAMPDRPETVAVGFVDDGQQWQWYTFTVQSGELQRTWLRSDPSDGIEIFQDGRTRIMHLPEDVLRSSEYRPFLDRLAAHGVPVVNMVCFSSPQFGLFALNYDKTVSAYDAQVLNSIVMQSLFLKSLAGQVRETENAFDYLVFALARAAEANDEDTGNHVLRVGEYCALIAQELGMSDKFMNIIRIQATLHDVGKIHIHPDILRKPGKLTPEEFEAIKQHTTSGGKILGDHVRLTLARRLALSHHERWDGTGYPLGLQGDQIPLEGRIMNIADQYDALRSARVYKPAFDHQKVYGILTEGDGRTMPHHFDPQILGAFKAAAPRFAEVYARLT